MNRIKWNINGYTLQYNPNQDQLSKSQTNKYSINANGTITVNNPFNDNVRQFTVDIYEKPMLNKLYSNVQTNKYNSISENIGVNQMMLFDGSNVDYYDIAIQNKIKTLTITSGNGISVPSVTSTGIVHLFSGSALIYPYDGTSGNSCSIIYTDENQVINRKYNYVDTDMKSVSSITWDGLSTIYGLNPYGAIFSFNTSSGASSLLTKFSDYAYNQTNNIQAYNSIHMYNGYIGVWGNSKLIYIDSNVNVIVEEDYISKPLYISSNGSTTNMYVLINSSIMSTKVSMAIVDLDSLINSLQAGVVPIITDNNSSFNLIVQNYSCDRKRNKADAMYSVSIQGLVM